MQEQKMFQESSVSGTAVEIACVLWKERMEKESQLRDYLIEKIEKEIPYCRLNGDRERASSE